MFIHTQILQIYRYYKSLKHTSTCTVYTFSWEIMLVNREREGEREGEGGGGERGRGGRGGREREREGGREGERGRGERERGHVLTCMSMEGGTGLESMAASDGIDPPPLWILVHVRACCACCILWERERGGERGRGGEGVRVRERERESTM